jgi:hypothetical protein
MGYSSTRGMAALRMARTALDHIIFEKIDPNDDLHEFQVRLSIIERNLTIADEKGLSAATRPSWKRLQKLRDGLGEIIR